MASSAPLRAALRRLPPEVWALGTVSLLTDTASDMVYPLLPKLLLAVGGGAMALGILEGTAELISSFVKVWAGRSADRRGRHGRYVVTGYLLATVSRPFLAIVTAPWQAVIARSLDRTGKGLRSAPRDAILTRVTPPDLRGIAFGVHRGMDNMGAVFGPLLAWVLMSGANLHFRTVIALAIVPGLLSTGLATWAVRKEQDALPEAEVSATGEHAPVPKEAHAFLAAVGVYALGASADSFLLLRLEALGMKIELIPIAWLTLQLAKSLLNVPGGALADRLGPRRVLRMSWIVYALSYAAFAWAPSWPMFWAFFAVYALHYGLGEGAEKSLLVRLVPKGARGTAFGMQHAIHGIALLPANIAFGWLYTRKPAIAFGLSASLALMAVLLLTVSTVEPAASTD